MLDYVSLCYVMLYYVICLFPILFVLFPWQRRGTYITYSHNSSLFRISCSGSHSTSEAICQCKSRKYCNLGWQDRSNGSCLAMIFLVLIACKHDHKSTQCAWSWISRGQPSFPSIYEYLRDAFTSPVYFRVPLRGGLRTEMCENLSVALKFHLWLLQIALCLRIQFVFKYACSGKGKGHPSTGHECPEVE
jgi:hypothetical protein